MKDFKEWLKDPVRVLNTLSVFFAGVTVGILLVR